MLPQTPVFFMNANAPPPPPLEPNKNKTNMNKKKIFKYSSTQYTDIIMLNYFRLKLVKFTKKKMNNKKLCKHTMSLLKQNRRNNNKNSKQKLCKHTTSCATYIIYVKFYRF